MTNEEKQLLKIQDLSARLPHGVIVDIKYNKEHGSSDRLRICGEGHSVLNTDILGLYIQDEIYIKPYLRPMSSMTTEEICKIEDIIGEEFTYKDEALTLSTEDIIRIPIYKMSELLRFMYQRHLDFNNLMSMGLALEALEGMYNFK